VRNDGVVKVFIIANGNGDRDAFSFVVDFNDDLGSFELLYFFLDQLLTCFLFVSCQGMRLFGVDLGLRVSQGWTAAFFGFALGCIFSFMWRLWCGTSSFALHANNLN